MKNRKQLLADFYLELLKLPHDEWRARHNAIYAEIRYALSDELQCDQETLQNIFERMAKEDK